jgi:hypothetical protein
LAAALWLAGQPVGAAVSQFAGNGQPLRWNFEFFDFGLAPVQNPTSLAIQYTLASEAWSTTNRVAELNAIRSAFAQWQAVPGTRVKFEEVGPASNPTDVDPLDGRNVVVWLAGNRFVNGGTTFFPASARAITILSTSDSDEIIAEADLVLNRSLNWFTDFDALRANDHFIEGIALHEIGHLLGLNHAVLGGATMFWTNPGGVDHTAGLSADEVSGLRTRYGTPAGAATVGQVSGLVTLNGAAVLGAVVTLEDAQGNVSASTVTLAHGSFSLGGLLPGTYSLRVTPLDPPTSGDTYLVRGSELDVTARATWNNAATAFLPATNVTVTVAANAVTTRNVAVTAGTPAFRIVELRQGLTSTARASGDFCVALSPGAAEQWLGVYVPGLTTTNVTLRLTGGGVSYGPAEVVLNALRGMTLVQVPVTVARDAQAGLRSVAVTANGFTAWANGFVELKPLNPDFNFDGLDDRFQRRYFAPFTLPQAGPEQDPDGDGFVNRREASMGSDPTKATSVNWRITSVKLTAQGTTVIWEGAPGRKYQVYSRENIAGATWQAVGTALTVAGESGQLLDARPTEQLRFYQVRDLP